MDPGVNVIKLYPSSLLQDKLECLSLSRLFQVSLTSTPKAGIPH